MIEANLKRDLVRQLLQEGGYGRRIEDKYAVGTLDLLLMTKRFVIYAEAKIMKGLVTLPIRATQGAEIGRFNRIGNPNACALIIGFRDGMIGFGLPGEHFLSRCACSWPLEMNVTLTEYLELAAEHILEKEPA
jgi:hypothetical protein